jgi:2-polyprenyl-6-methoxyphenol hydroxylase-like FAD-dependent oxidoreductase
MTDKTLQSDVLIVGAGPAGCVLSYLLARSGIDVTLVEREADLYREFRGYAFQPLVVRLLDQMELLDALEDEVPLEKHPKFYLQAFGRKYVGFDYTILSESPHYGLSMEQPPFLRFLIDRAEQFDSFTFYDSTAVTNLLREDDAVVGVTAHNRDRNEEWDISTRLVVGADGRYSTVREAAGIDPCREEADIQIVWVKVPREAVEMDEAGRFEADGLLLYFPLGEEVQIGLFIKAGEYPEIRSQGIETFRNRLTAIDPSLKPVLEEHLSDFGQCSLLPPDPGISEEWVQHGLLLIGDAAHIANPFGAQGNSLAIQDAVAAHPYIVRSLTESSEPLRAHQLQEFEDDRRPAVKTVMDAQAQQMAIVENYHAYQDVLPAVVWKYIIRGLLGLTNRYPSLGKQRTQLYAFGPNPIPVDTSLFEN